MTSFPAEIYAAPSLPHKPPNKPYKPRHRARYRYTHTNGHVHNKHNLPQLRHARHRQNTCIQCGHVLCRRCIKSFRLYENADIFSCCPFSSLSKRGDKVDSGDRLIEAISVTTTLKISQDVNRRAGAGTAAWRIYGSPFYHILLSSQFAVSDVGHPL